MSSGVILYGNKYTNLEKAKNLIGETPFVSQCGFSDEQIKALFSKKTCELWTQGNGCSKLSSRREIYELVQKGVEEDILASQLELTEEQQKFLSKHQDKKLIMRSSSDEDEVNNVRAGKNLTIGGLSAKGEELKTALAKVVSSYFSEESLRNQILSKNASAKMPLCSVLLMEQVVEEEGKMVVSGVTVTHQQGWAPLAEGRISQVAATWGFGGGVMSGKVPCDEWVVTNDFTYKTIRRKPFRLIASCDGEAKQEPNSSDLRHQSVLSEAHLQELQGYGIRLEQGFGSGPLEIEFVIKNEKITIVQVRPAVHILSPANPHFLDIPSLPKGLTVIQAKPFLPGTYQVETLELDQICVASNIEEADRNFDPAKHQAVVLFEKPGCRNTHGEVNFNESSIPCVILTEEKWNELSRLAENTSVKFCSQTGSFVITSSDLPIRSGRFLHPACFEFSVNSSSCGIQNASSHPLIQKLNSQLTATPEELKANLETIHELLDQIFLTLSKRKGNTASLQQVSKKVQQVAWKIWGAMQQSAEKNHLMSLSLHGAMLRQLLHQNNPEVLGSHSISGIETATDLPPNIEDFLDRHGEKDLLKNLAMMAQKAFDKPVQDQWLLFLENHLEKPNESWELLLAYIHLLDELGILDIWFSFHFKKQLPNFEMLVHEGQDTSLLGSSQHFKHAFAQIFSRLEKATSKEDLDSAWKTLTKESATWIAAQKKSPTKNPLQTMLFSELFVDLINLWDFSVKTVRTSKIYSGKEEETLFRQRINIFADWGIRLCSNPAMNINRSENIEKVLKHMAHRGLSDSRPISSQDSHFNVQQWIVPKGRKHLEIKNEDQRLTIIHQNLLQGAAQSPSPEIRDLVPGQLLRALEIAEQQFDQVRTKRYAESNGKFFSFADGYAKVKINIPLNCHSFVLELFQKKHSNAVEVKACWRSFDNSYTYYLDSLKVFASLTGIHLKGFEAKDGDLQVDFISQNEEQISLISQAIKLTFADLHSTYKPLDAVTKLVATFRKTENLALVKKEIVAQMLEQYINGGDLPGFISKDQCKKYFSNYPMSMELRKKVVSDLEKTPPEKRDLQLPYIRLIPFALSAMSEEEKYQVIWKDLNGAQNLSHSEVLKWGGLEIFHRLISENPTKAVAYYSFYQDSIKDERARYQPVRELFDNFHLSILKDVVEKGAVTLSLTSVSKKQLEQFSEAELEKIIWADLKSAQSIRNLEYPEAAYPILKIFFDKCRSEAISYVLKTLHSSRSPQYESFLRKYAKQNPEFEEQVKEAYRQ